VCGGGANDKCWSTLYILRFTINVYITALQLLGDVRLDFRHAPAAHRHQLGIPSSCVSIPRHTHTSTAVKKSSTTRSAACIQ
ncbi:MAG: hypothetical protein ACKPKO_08225, partial [Candidatus Fonsibacter sp.]